MRQTSRTIRDDAYDSLQLYAKIQWLIVFVHGSECIDHRMFLSFLGSSTLVWPVRYSFSLLLRTDISFSS
jgi:hypothetical protein